MRLLVAEDDPTSRLLLDRVLSKWGHEVITAVDGAAALAVLEGADPPALAILDWVMPKLDGVEVCRRLRARETDNPPYLIMLTGRGGKEDIVAGLDAGADDYLGKPFDPDELRARVEVGRRFAELNAKLLATRQALDSQARTDPLTGAMNRRAILEVLHEELSRANREATLLSVGMLDVDHFKLVNDAYGHAGGDQLLQQLVARIGAALRPYDHFGRFGGEEFLIVVPGAGSTLDPRSFLDRIRKAVCGAPFDLDGAEVCISVSMGGALSCGGSVDELIRAADLALYAAKAQGRNRVAVADLSQSGRGLELAS